MGTSAQAASGGGRGDAKGSLLPLAIAAAGALLVAAIAIIYLFLAHPAMDDFCRASVEDAVEHIVLLYRHHTGRWLVTALHGVMQPRIGIGGLGFSLALAAMLVAWFSGFVLGAGLILGRDAPKHLRWLLALLLFAAFWAGSPSQAETFYWLSGSVDYGLPFLLLLASLRLLLAVDTSRRGRMCAAGAGALGFAASGAHEFAGMLLLAGALLRLAVLWAANRKREAGYVALATVAIAIGFAIVVLAPGNAERASNFPMRGDPSRAIGQTFRLGEAPLEWLLDIRLVALSGLLLTLPAFRALRPNWLTPRLPWPLLLAAGTLTAILASHVLAAFVIGFPPPGRMLSLLYAIFILGWFATLVAVAAHLGAAPRGTGKAALLPSLAAVAFALSLVASVNSVAAARGLRHTTAPWLSENARQTESVRRQREAGRRDLVLPTVTAVPAPLMKQGLSDNPRWWLNVCMADYLKVDTVRAPAGEGERARRIWRGER